MTANNGLRIGLCLILILIPASGTPERQLATLATVELVADGFKQPTAVAVGEDGAIYVSDPRAGTITRILPNGRARAILTGLKRPVGLAIDPDGRLLIVEEGRGRLLRRDPSGPLTVLASGIKKPRWLAIGEDGTIFLSAKGLRRARDRDDDEDEDDDDGRRDRHEEVILRLGSGRTLTRFIDGFTGLEGIAVQNESLFAVTEQLRGERGRQRSSLVRIPITPDGDPGPLETLLRREIRHPLGVALDSLGAVFLTVKRLHDMRHQGEQGVILKWLPHGRLVPFATGLKGPRGLAFEPEGHLLVAEGPPPHRGRLLRFRAPPPPTISAPAMTNQSPVGVTGQAEPGSLVTVFRADDGTALASAAASTASGAFTLAIPLLANSNNALVVSATGANGSGLTGAPADLTILHDDEPPGVTILEPRGGAFVRQTITLKARATDGGSGVSTLALTLNGRTPETVIAPDPSQPFLVTLPLDTTTLPDGAHTVSATAADRAGNRASTSQSLIVDNASPDTQITGGPAGQIDGTQATFTFTGTDNLTPPANLVFAWRIDGGTWSAFGPETTVTLAGLAEGAHLFEVRARDLAGNEDPAAAQRSFTVGRLLRVAITEPGEGAAVTAGLLLVRGMIEPGGVEVGVIVNGVPAAVQGSTFAALVPVTPETSTLSALATSVTGATATHITTLRVTPTTGPDLTLHASPSIGVAPLTVLFSLTGGPAPSQATLDADGNGQIDFSGPRLEQQPFTFTQPGLYVATAAATDALGNRQTATSIVQVFDRTALDGVLQAKWTALKDALRRGDIPHALTQIATPARGRYEAIFRALAQDLPDIDMILTDLALLEVRGREAIHEMVRIDSGVTTSFEVRFRLDDDGIWRLAAF